MRNFLKRNPKNGTKKVVCWLNDSGNLMVRLSVYNPYNPALKRWFHYTYDMSNVADVESFKTLLKQLD